MIILINYILKGSIDRRCKGEQTCYGFYLQQSVNLFKNLWGGIIMRKNGIKPIKGSTLKFYCCYKKKVAIIQPFGPGFGGIQTRFFNVNFSWVKESKIICMSHYFPACILQH